MFYRVFRMYADFEKEEKWLNEMSEKGYQFDNYNIIRYRFIKDDSIKYNYQIELLDQMPSHPKNIEYFSFLKDLDIEVAGTYFRWVYLKKDASKGPFELYSDYDSKIKHYKKIITLQGIVGIANFIIGINNVSIGFALGTFNSNIGLINIGLSIIIGSLCVKNFFRIKTLTKEKNLRES